MPYTHYKFPVDPHLKEQWIRAVSRRDSFQQTRWTPNENSVVCSAHFVDGAPTDSNPYPTLNLGYSMYNRPAKPRTGMRKTKNIIQKEPVTMVTTAVIADTSKSCEDWLTVSDDTDRYYICEANHTTVDGEPASATANDGKKVQILEEKLAACKRELFGKTLLLKSKTKN